MTEEQFSNLRALFSELEEHEAEIKKIKDKIAAIFHDYVWDLKKFY